MVDEAGKYVSSVISKIDLELEKLYRKLFSPFVRGSKIVVDWTAVLSSAKLLNKFLCSANY